MVDLLEVEELQDGFKDGCRHLKSWFMDSFAHGENSCENITKDFVRQRKPVSKDIKKQHSAHELVRIMVPTWERPDFHDGGSAPKLLMCHNCHREFDTVKQCVACKQVWYCGSDCQKRHWKAGHKEVCKRMAEAAKEKAKEGSQGQTKGENKSSGASRSSKKKKH